MKIIIQTLPYEVFNEAEKINALFKSGLDILHIRKPDFSNAKISKIIDSINKEFHDRIVLHSNYGLVRKYNLKGIHVGFSKLNGFVSSKYYQILKNNYNLTVSSTVNEVDFKKINKSIVDYIFIGPVYKKYSEESIILNKNLFELSSKIKNIDVEVFAINCFTLNNIKSILNAGFNGPVLQAFIWK